MLDLVGNPEDRFSQNEANLFPYASTYCMRGSRKFSQGGGDHLQTRGGPTNLPLQKKKKNICRKIEGGSGPPIPPLDLPMYCTWLLSEMPEINRCLHCLISIYTRFCPTSYSTSIIGRKLPRIESLIGVKSCENGSYSDIYLSLVLRKPVFGVSDQVRHKAGCTATIDGYMLEISGLESFCLPPIPGYYQYFWGVNVSCSRKQTHRPGRGSNPGLPIRNPTL